MRLSLCIIVLNDTLLLDFLHNDLCQKLCQDFRETVLAAIATNSAVDDTRTAEAISLIKSVLKLEKIEDTTQIDKFIAAIVPLLILPLPKTAHRCRSKLPSSRTSCRHSRTSCSHSRTSCSIIHNDRVKFISDALILYFHLALENMRGELHDRWM
jgi:hypothetical protein